MGFEWLQTYFELILNLRREPHCLKVPKINCLYYSVLILKLKSLLNKFQQNIWQKYSIEILRIALMVQLYSFAYTFSTWTFDDTRAGHPLYYAAVSVSVSL